MQIQVIKSEPNGYRTHEVILYSSTFLHVGEEIGLALPFGEYLTVGRPTYGNFLKEIKFNPSRNLEFGRHQFSKKLKKVTLKQKHVHPLLEAKRYPWNSMQCTLNHDPLKLYAVYT